MVELLVLKNSVSGVGAVLSSLNGVESAKELNDGVATIIRSYRDVVAQGVRRGEMASLSAGTQTSTRHRKGVVALYFAGR